MIWEIENRGVYAHLLKVREKRGTRSEMTTARLFEGEIDGHYSLARLNSFPIFRGGMSKRRSNGRYGGIRVCRFGIICWFAVDHPIFLPLPSLTFIPMFPFQRVLMNNHADILIFDLIFIHE